MLSYIYIPFDAFQRSSWSKNTSDFLTKPQCIVGYHLGNAYIVVDIIATADESELQAIDANLKIIGYANAERLSDQKQGHIYLRFHHTSKLPFVDSSLFDESQKFTMILFAPPNLRNLEYFTVRPILLQSTNMASKIIPVNKIPFIPDENQGRYSICNEYVLDKINACSKVRSEIRCRSFSRATYSLSNNSILSILRTAIMKALTWTIGALLSVMIWVISCLNTDICGMNPIQTSTWCRQFDLRLRQVSYFPFQFLSYYDTNFLKAEVQAQLGIPMSNERYNVNNSNYINLYNTIWLMINDILIGSTIYRVFSRDLGPKLQLLNQTLFNVSFIKLDSFISWIGSDYPGGFKLNNDLGQFMELLFLWTSQTCSEVFQFLAFSSESNTWFTYLVKSWFTISCCLGVSFTTAFFIDYIKIVNFHTYVFSLAATKIYYRQVEMLKSLFQLFRGRKYNVLRNRIDKIEEDQLRIDQLLLGTFVFLVLIYLLPTTFAFYVLFYSFRVTMITCLKLGDKFILCFDLSPLFVILLKLKNSRRLQGGVHFTYKGYHDTTDWVVMENKALTFDEICGNFIHVFRQEGRFDRLLLNFAEGIEMQLRDTTTMKFQYLMLPENHVSLAKIWNETVNEGLK